MKLTPFPTPLKNGVSVLVRDVTSTDRHLLEIGFAHLSGRARYFRFLGAHTPLTEKELDRITAANDPDHVAAGALLRCRTIPEPIGIARYIRLPDQKHGGNRTLYDYAFLQFLAKAMYPEQFADLDPQASLDRFFATYMPVEFKGTYMTQLPGSDE